MNVALHLPPFWSISSYSRSYRFCAYICEYWITNAWRFGLSEFLLLLISMEKIFHLQGSNLSMLSISCIQHGVHRLTDIVVSSKYVNFWRCSCPKVWMSKSLSFLFFNCLSPIPISGGVVSRPRYPYTSTWFQFSVAGLGFCTCLFVELLLFLLIIICSKMCMLVVVL